MSEVIDYWGIVKNFEPVEKEEIIRLIKEFQDAEIRCESSEKIEFHVEEGWRGGGASCEDLVKEHFGEYCQMHPHVEFEIYAIYVEHNPCDVIRLRGDMVEVDGTGWY